MDSQAPKIATEDFEVLVTEGLQLAEKAPVLEALFRHGRR